MIPILTIIVDASASKTPNHVHNYISMYLLTSGLLSSPGYACISETNLYYPPLVYLYIF